jgi:hypothetical protein
MIITIGFTDGAVKKWHTVAADKGGVDNHIHLQNGSDYIFQNRELPVSDVVTAQSELRSVIFGEEVVFGYKGFVTNAHYRIRAAFLSEKKGRSVCVLAGDSILEKRLELIGGKPVIREWAIPPSAYADGMLTFAVRRISGPNAVISKIEILSDNPALLTPKPKPLDPALADIEYPRLTPRPQIVPGVKTLRLSLNGNWDFSVNSEDFFQDTEDSVSAKPSKILVPGEWSMQGFSVPANQAAAYRREFILPESWIGRHRIKLRCNAVYSECGIWINGRKVGSHEGGFTPFEIDVTDAVKAGNNRIILTVKNESLADTLASGTKYAAHPLGGISRDIYLFTVPEIHIEHLHITTDLDASYHNAALVTDIKISNEGTVKYDNIECRQSLRPFSRTGINKQSLQLPDIVIGSIMPDQSTNVTAESEVAEPLKWDPEHPNLYILTTKLLVNGKVVEVLEERFGFREVEIRGNRLFVNGRPVKLRGVCRHEVDPLLGRTLRHGQWKKDADIFRKGNCNFIRTSHYPPDEAFLDACDELGLFVEDEAPFCWANKHDARSRDLVTHETLEMVERDRNHPCVIYWSLANESKWGKSFEFSAKAVRHVDPSRPRIFSYGKCDIRSWHYPAITGPDKVADSHIPVIFDEYCHLNAYNRYELTTDPGVRDAWGKGLTQMWEKMYISQGCLGGSLWAAIDDSFAMPDGTWVGYGTWGPIDGWRRAKPEYWHMKKSYSPVWIKTRKLSVPSGNGIEKNKGR